MPETIKKRQAMQQIKTRKDYNEYIASLKRFSEKGAEKLIKGDKGLKLTEWEWDEYKREERKSNLWKQREKKRIENLPELSRGKKTGNKVQMGKEETNALKPVKRDINKIRSNDWDRIRRAIDFRTSDMKNAEYLKRVKDNYIQSMITTGIDDDIIEHVKKIDAQTIADKMIVDKEAETTFVYSREELQTKNDALRRVWGIETDNEE